jgi:hypothetical protein
MTTLSHYTSLTGLEGIAKTGTLWATNFTELNDTSEYFYAWEILQRDAIDYIMARIPSDLKRPDANLDAVMSQTIVAFRNVLRSSSGYGRLYMSSFARAKTEDQERRGILTLWERYTKHEGYCLQFDKSDVERMLNLETMKGNYAAAGLSEVTYGVDKVTPEFKELCFQFGEWLLLKVAQQYRDGRIDLNYSEQWAESYLIRSLLNYCGTHKDPCYEDEREVRIFVCPIDGADARVFTGIAQRKAIRTAPSGKKYIALGEYWKPGLAPRRIIIGTRANLNVQSILAMYDRSPEVARADFPIAA